MTKDEMTRIALECGFQLKDLPDGTKGLHRYVYEFAEFVATRAVKDATRPLLIENEQLRAELNRHGVELRNAVAKAVKVERDACKEIVQKYLDYQEENDDTADAILEDIRARDRERGTP